MIGGGGLVEHRRSKEIAIAGRKYIAKTGNLSYKPNVRGEGTEKEAKSSSAHKDPKKAWVSYESPRSDLLSPNPPYDADSDGSEDSLSPNTPQVSRTTISSGYNPRVFNRAGAIASQTIVELSEEENDELDEEDWFNPKSHASPGCVPMTILELAGAILGLKTHARCGRMKSTLP